MQDDDRLKQELAQWYISGGEYLWLRRQLDNDKRESAIQRLFGEIEAIERRIDRLITVSEVWKIWADEAERLRLTCASLAMQDVGAIGLQTN
jgi:hypothetical protein